MPRESTSAQLPPDWDVPPHTAKEFFRRSSDTCVVIPVINEGRRIGSLLERMSSLDVQDSADVIIVDGGSTDGSLSPALLSSHRVQGLLTLTKPLGLSAQLRVAYAHALILGYNYFVTIDGNDKDDPEGIARIISALQSGADFVQGSRFVSGGQAVNTPLIRDLAIRVIHAPLLSLASGFRWTDTTQGFRGYSRALLADTRINVFRPIFLKYELLAYLSYRAPRLGFRCLEVGTVREYPKGKTPTKISVVRGNIIVFSTLIRACLGKYNPRST
jgi:dolichol-phosphate mannosyltransferase